MLGGDRRHSPGFSGNSADTAPAALPDDVFLAERTRLAAIANAVVGAPDEAEDVVQDVWLRWRAHRHTLTAPDHWLATVTRRAAIDHVRRRRTRHSLESQWADLVERASRPAALSSAEAYDTLVAGVRVLLHTLSPLERSVFVLRQAFAWSYAEIAVTLARSEDSVRQLNHRAAQHVAAGVHRYPVSAELADRATAAFLAVCAGGQESDLLSVLASEPAEVGPEPLGRYPETDGEPSRSRSQSQKVHDVAGAILISDRHVLLCHRRSDLDWYPDVWDIPGAHRRPDEHEQDTVTRACRDELGICASSMRPAMTVEGADFRLGVQLVPTWYGEPRNRSRDQHDAMGFFDLGALERLRIPEEMRERLAALLTG